MLLQAAGSLFRSSHFPPVQLTTSSANFTIGDVTGETNLTGIYYPVKKINVVDICANYLEVTQDPRSRLGIINKYDADDVGMDGELKLFK